MVETHHADIATVWIVVILLPLLLSLPLGIIVTVGGWRMLQGRSYGLAVTASILALFPCQPLSILGMVFGIWSLIVLNRPGVKALMKLNATAAGRAPRG